MTMVWLSLFRMLSNRVLFRVLSDRVLFKVLSHSVLFRVLNLRFLPSVASAIATDVLVLSLGIFSLIQLTKIWASFWEEKKSFILEFWLGSEYTYAESSIFRSIHPEVFWKIAFLEGFSKFPETFPWWRTFQISYRPKNIPRVSWIPFPVPVILVL